MENLASARTAVRVYVALSIATVVVLVCLQVLHPELAGTPAWVRGTIVAATSLLMLRFAGQAIAGDDRALLRWRIVVVVVLVALVAVVLVPGLMPPVDARRAGGLRDHSGEGGRVDPAPPTTVRGPR